MATVFWAAKVVLFMDFLLYGYVVNIVRYCETLYWSEEASGRKKLEYLRQDIILLNGTAFQYTAHQTKK